MALQAKSGFVGLVTNIAETQSPEGALVEAENVVIRKRGAVECRDGVNKVAAVSGGAAAWGFSWRSKDFFVRNDSNDIFDWRDTAGGTYQYTDLVSGAIDPQPMRRDIFSRAEARGNLYLPYDSGALKMDTDSGPWKMAGLPLYCVPISSALVNSGTTWLANNEQVAYRLVCTRQDANGLVVRSIPSGAFIASNTSGGARHVQLTVVSDVSVVSLFDYVEIYRTRSFPTSVAPDDEMQLVGRIPTGAFTSGVATLTDQTSPASRGATLYTSPSRGGIGAQNERPPASALVASFRGSLFFGNVRGPRRIRISSALGNTNRTGSVSGVGLRIAAGDTTFGSNQILNVTPTTGLERGMIVSALGFAPTAGQPLPYITNISGSTITVSVNAASTNVGTPVVLYDAIKVGANWYYSYVLDGWLNRIDAERYQAYQVTPPEGGYGQTYVIESVSRSSAAETILATHGNEYVPPLPLYSSTPLALEQDVWPGGIYWSKTDEPEHVAPGNFAFVGDKKRALLGMVTTRDALFILKVDGVFRLTGYNGQWRIDPFDPNCFCVLPMSVQTLNGRALFLSAEGVVALDDGGVELVSRPINDQVKPFVDQVLVNWRTNAFYEVNGSQGASYSAVFDRENEYTLMRSSTDNHLVYNADTGAWTTWKYHAHESESYANRAVFYFGRTGRVIYAMGGDYYETLLSTSVSSNYERYDRASSITVDSYGAGIATLSAPITALEDDIIEDANERFWRITADVVASASVPVELEGGTATMGTGAGCWLYRAQRCKVVATGYTDPSVSAKRMGSFMTAWQRLVGAVVLKYGYQSSESPDWQEEDAVSSVSVSNPDAVGDGYTDYGLGFSVTGHIPTTHARAWLLRARVRWAMAFGQAQLEVMAAEFTPMISGSRSQVAA